MPSTLSRPTRSWFSAASALALASSLISVTTRRHPWSIQSDNLKKLHFSQIAKKVFFAHTIMRKKAVSLVNKNKCIARALDRFEFAHSDQLGLRIRLKFRLIMKTSFKLNHKNSRALDWPVKIVRCVNCLKFWHFSNRELQIGIIILSSLLDNFLLFE